MAERIVYVVSPVDFSLKEAEHWGKIVRVNDRYIFGDQVDDKGNIPDSFDDRLRAAALQFTPEFDHLLIGGDHLQMVVFASYLARYYTYYRVLRYDRESKGYWPARVSTVATSPVSKSSSNVTTFGA